MHSLARNAIRPAEVSVMCHNEWCSIVPIQSRGGEAKLRYLVKPGLRSEVSEAHRLREVQGPHRLVLIRAIRVSRALLCRKMFPFE